MQSLLKVSDAVNLAMHASAILASNPQGIVSAKELAARLNASEATLSKAMQRLVREGIVRSTRGPSGGFFLAREPETISLKEIVEAVDGRLRAPECLFGRQPCGRRACMLGDAMVKAHRILIDKLERTRLHEVPIALGARENPVEQQGKKARRKP